MAGLLKDRRALITGAGSTEGIGFGVARALAAAGARVALADLSPQGLERSVAALDAEGIEASSVVLDIADEAAVRDAMAKLQDRFGGLDVLVNNAASLGHAEDRLIGNMPVDLWDRIFAVNARGTMLMCKHALPMMTAGGGGAIVNISSGTARAGDMFASAYAASKGAVNTLTAYVATQYGAQGVRCNAIAPGLVTTARLLENLPSPMLEIFKGHSLNGRLCEPRDIADMAVFLASDMARMITGETIYVDGGFYAHIASVPEVTKLFGEMQAQS